MADSPSDDSPSDGSPSDDSAFDGSRFDGMPDWMCAAGELYLGAAILGVRRLNVLRNEPHLAGDLLDAGLDALGAAIPPVSAALAEIFDGASETAPEAWRGALIASRDVVAKAPHFARLAGLLPDD